MFWFIRYCFVVCFLGVILGASQVCAAGLSLTYVNPVSTQTATVGQAFEYAIPADTFEPEAVYYEALLSPDADDLPAWLSLSAGGVFFGTPQSGDAGTLEIVVHACANLCANGEGEGTFTLVVQAPAGGSSGASGQVADDTRYRIRKYFGERIARNSANAGEEDDGSGDDEDAGDDEEPVVGAGTMWGIGHNKFGTLGIGSPWDDAPSETNVLTPAVMDEMGGAVFSRISIGYIQACGVDGSNKAWCWGTNVEGALGLGADAESYGYPKAVVGNHAFNRIGVADNTNHACALDTSGLAWCWGSDSYGQLGDNRASGGTSAYPVQVQSGAVRFAKLAVFTAGACALDNDGAMWCWGRYGGMASDVPAAVGAGHAFMEVAGRGNHVCGLKTDGSVWCFGDNSYGQLGDGSYDDSTVPVAVSGGIPFAAVSVGLDHTCGLAASGVAYCWGSNWQNQLGIGDGASVGYDSATPVRVVGIHAFSKIAAGNQITCALETSGTLWCWGQDGSGTISSFQPVAVAMPEGKTFGSLDVASGIIALVGTPGAPPNVGGTPVAVLTVSPDSATGMDVVAPSETGSYVTFTVANEGAATSPVLGTTLSNANAFEFGTNGCAGHTLAVGANCTVTVRAKATANGVLSGVLSVSASGVSSAQAILSGTASGFASSDTVAAWGYNANGELNDGSTDDRHEPVLMQNPDRSGDWTGIASIMDSTAGYVCARKNDGSIWCWGYNDSGMLGADGANDIVGPVEMTSLGSATSFAANGHICAVRSGGTVWCLGYNDYGQLGDGTTDFSDTAVQVAGLSGVRQVVTAYSHTCALKTDGTVWCWGYDAPNQGFLGTGTGTESGSPVQVAGAGGVGYLTGVAQISATAEHTCALKSDGTVWCWGMNDNGQLGYDDGNGYSLAPVQVVGEGGAGYLTGIAEIETAAWHSCARKDDGTVWCWGYNWDGELGDGTTDGSATPVQVVDETGSGTFANAVAIAAVGEGSCAVRSDNSVWCWGGNYSGGLGNDSTERSLIPVRVHGIDGDGYLEARNVFMGWDSAYALLP